MDIDDLRIKQAEFEGDRQENKKRNVGLEKKRIRFTKLFPEEKIKSLKIDDYVSGKRNRNSFCNYLETGLRELGEIHGSTAIKFGIYYGIVKKDKTPKYRFKAVHGKTDTQAFEAIKTEITKLLVSARTRNLQAIRGTNLTPMFKGKILSTYFPDIFLNIFSAEHLDYFLVKLGIPFGDSIDVFEKRGLLMAFKNNDVVMRAWTTNEFSNFLYKTFGRPPQDLVQDELKEYLQAEFPHLSKVNPKFLKLNLSDLPEKKQTMDKSRPRKIDFDREQKVNKRLGDRGEEIVLKKEKGWLESIGKGSLVLKVQHVAKVDDTAGFDILSFDENGVEKRIEVKSTRRKYGFASFLISESEYRKSQTMDNYFIYVVFEADTINPKILPVKKPFDLPKSKIRISPVNYRVEMNMVGG